MKTIPIAFSAASVLVVSLIIIGTFKTGIVSALTATTTDATSTVSDTTTASTSSTPTTHGLNVGCKLNICRVARPSPSTGSSTSTNPRQQ